MSGILDQASSSVPALGEGDALAIAGAAAFVIILVSSTIGWGLWMAYRTTKILSTATKTRITQRVPSSRADTVVSEMSTLEMGASFLKTDACNDWEPTQLPYLRSQNSAFSTSLPTLPERAYVSGWAPFPPSLPRCQTLDALRSPIMISHSTSDLCGVEVVLGTTNNNADQMKETQIPPSLEPVLINFDESFKEQPVPLPAPYYAGLGLTLIDVEAVTDDLTVQGKADEVQDTPLQAGDSLLDSSSETRLSNHLSLDPVPAPCQLPSPLVTPILPTLVLTSASFNRTPNVMSEESKPVSQLISPPETPTLLLTAPSIHCGLDLSVEGMIDHGVDEELESWSDVLGFQEYEDNEDLLDRATCRLLDDFPTPPKTPKRCSISNVPPFASADHDARSELSVPGVSFTPLQAKGDEYGVDRVEGNAEESPYDYAAFHERIGHFLKDVNSQKMVAPAVTVENSNGNASVTTDDLPTSSSNTHFDYARLRARKRSHTLLSNISVPQTSPVHVGPRPLPLPAEFPPLLCRTVDRPRRQASP